MSTPPSRPASEPESLARLRAEIEQVDREVIRLIARRIDLARQVGAVKRAAGLPALDPGREAAVIRRVSEVAREEGAPEEDVRYLFWHIIGMSRRVQLIEE
ncbi:MAG: chorismate mutase [Gemmatimonadota bacterium]|nr:chorismate mutase [Gemmatimonadota bacterium]HEU4988469.1 chorismate mutase [Gemmatimonadaceae bacterium]